MDVNVATLDAYFEEFNTFEIYQGTEALNHLWPNYI